MTNLMSRTQAVGLVAAALGGGAGLIHVLVGTSGWTGNKSDPTTLGFVSVGLAIAMGVAASRATHAPTTGRALLVAGGLAVPAIVGLTASGLAWIPAALGGLAAASQAVVAAKRMGSITGAMSASWATILLGVLAATYVALGITSGGLRGMLGVAGAIIVLYALRVRSRATGAGLLALGALPFAIATATSLVTPLTAVLIIVIGTATTRTGIPMRFSKYHKASS